MKEYVRKNPEKDKINRRRYYERNKSKILVKVKIYQEENRDKKTKRQREHYAENRDRLVREQQENRKKDPEKYNAIARKSAKKHRTKILRKKKEGHESLRESVLKYYSKGTPKCNKCSIAGVPFLNMDHIHGRKQMGHDRNMGTGKFYRYLDKEHPTGYQVLCYNCNMIKELKRIKKEHMQSPMAIKRRRQRLDTKKFVLSGYSKGKPKCTCCGFSNLDGLALDHIEGRKKMGHSREFGSDDLRMSLKKEYKKTGKWPQGFQVLCHNCNGAKRGSSVCPHQLN